MTHREFRLWVVRLSEAQRQQERLAVDDCKNVSAPDAGMASVMRWHGRTHGKAAEPDGR